jgi:hypothetical protein
MAVVKGMQENVHRTAPAGNRDNPALGAVSQCLDALAQLVSAEKRSVAEHLLATVQHTTGRILQLHSELREMRTDLIEVLRRTRIPMTKPEAVSHFISTIEALSDVEEEQQLLGQLRKASVCVQAFQRLIELLTQPKQTRLQDAQECVTAIEELIQTEARRDCAQRAATHLWPVFHLGHVGWLDAAGRAVRTPRVTPGFHHLCADVAEENL